MKTYTTKDDALKLALDALTGFDYDTRLQAIAAIREALEQPAQQQEQIDWEAVAADQAMTIALIKSKHEPVAWWNRIKDTVSTDPVNRKNTDCQPLYAAPQQLYPMTDYEISAAWIAGNYIEGAPQPWAFHEGVKAAEKHHGMTP